MIPINPVQLDPAAKGAFWKEHIDRFLQSPLTRAAYCREHGLNLHQLIYWKKRFSRQATDSVSFVSLDIAGIGTSSAAGALSMFTCNGYRIQVGRGFDPATLKKLVATLEGP